MIYRLLFVRILTPLNCVPKQAILPQYSPCNMAIFATFQTLVIFSILGVSSSRFLHRTTLMCFYSPFCQDFDTFKFPPKIGHFALLQPMQYGHFFHFSNSCQFSTIRRFIEPFSAQNNFNVPVQSFLLGFLNFSIPSPNMQFCLTIAYAIWPFLPLLQLLSFFEYWAFFRAAFCIKDFNVFLQSFFLGF